MTYGRRSRARADDASTLYHGFDENLEKGGTEQGSYCTACFLQEGERGVADQSSAGIYVLITCCKAAEQKGNLCSLEMALEHHEPRHSVQPKQQPKTHGLLVTRNERDLLA
jgi:hypothetical protein